jgi:undecaprenyl-diphosphatase
MIWQALVLGVIQGLTEFLPISSSAHLTLLPWLFGWSSPLLNSLTFDVALHLGTLLALLGYFWRDLVRLIAAWARGLGQGRPFADPDARLAWFIAAATVPAVVFGVPFEHTIETAFRAPALIAICLMGLGLLLALAERVSARTRPLSELTLWQSLAIGTAQALALVPGVSRSGVTLTAGLALGLRREDAARFSFLLAIPTTAGAVALKLKPLVAAGLAGGSGSLVVGVLASALVGLLVIHGLLGFLRRYPVYVFAAYRLAFGGFVLWWALSGR